MQSKIFTQAELKAIKEAEKGNHKDKSGIFYGRVKPKIIEIIKVWIPKKKELNKLIKPMRKNGKK